jgi:hypothetical protein
MSVKFIKKNKKYCIVVKIKTVVTAKDGTCHLSDLMEVIRFGGLFLAKPKENCKEKN